MSEQWIIRIFIYLLMASILIALGSGLYFLLFAKEKSEKTAKALTIRIGLSLALFILLFVGFAIGWIRPHELIPISNKQRQIEKATPHLQNANTRRPLQNQNGALV